MYTVEIVYDGGRDIIAKFNQIRLAELFIESYRGLPKLENLYPGWSVIELWSNGHELISFQKLTGTI